MDLARFEITPALRHALEPLILDALFEYSVRHRTKTGLANDAPAALTVTQAMEVLAAQHSRWEARLHAVLGPLGLVSDGLPRRIGAQLHELLARAHEFFRREGAVTFRAAVGIPNDGQRFGLLWTDVFSRRVLDWLRENELVTDPDHLDIADTMVECAKLWTQELSVLAGPKAGPPVEPSAFFLDADTEVSALFERGPIKLRVRGKPETLWLRPVTGGFHLHACRSGEPELAALRIVQAVFFMALMERSRKLPCVGGTLAFFRFRSAHFDPGFTLDVERAFAGFVGNAAAVRRLKLGVSLGLRHTPPRMADNYLVTGAAGLGKRELARRVASGLGVPLIELAAENVKTMADLLAEIDRALLKADLWPVDLREEEGKQVIEYPALVLLLNEAPEWRRLADRLRPLLDPQQRRVFTDSKVALFPAVTLLVAASEAAKIPEPMLALCRRIDIEPYRPEEVAVMLRTVFGGNSLPEDLARLVARMGRCNPGSAMKLAREFHEHHERDPQATPLTREALLRVAHEDWHLDERGLTTKDYQYLQALESGAKGLPALQQLLPFNGDVVTTSIEPYLIQLGAVYRSSRGRVLTVLGEQLLHRREK